MWRRGLVSTVIVAVAANAVAGQRKSTIAADPIVGTWKLNLTQSEFPRADLQPKNHVEVYRRTGSGRVELTLTRTMANGSPDNFKGTWPEGGGVVEEARDLRGLLIVETLVAPGEWYVTQMKSGTQFATIHKVVSTDGKSMRQVVKGVDPQGHLFVQIQVFDRQ